MKKLDESLEIHNSFYFSHRIHESIFRLWSLKLDLRVYLQTHESNFFLQCSNKDQRIFKAISCCMYQNDFFYCKKKTVNRKRKDNNKTSLPAFSRIFFFTPWTRGWTNNLLEYWIFRDEGNFEINITTVISLN